MSSPRLEAMLAHLYTDETFRIRFVADPRSEAIRFGLTEDEANEMANMDMVGLSMAAKSYERKRSNRKKGDGKTWMSFLKSSPRSFFRSSSR